MPMVVADRIEPLVAHGLRLTDQTNAERAVISAASARTRRGIEDEHGSLSNHEGFLCSPIALCRKMESARRPLAARDPNALPAS